MGEPPSAGGVKLTTSEAFKAVTVGCAGAEGTAAQAGPAATIPTTPVVIAQAVTSRARARKILRECPERSRPVNQVPPTTLPPGKW